MPRRIDWTIAGVLPDLDAIEPVKQPVARARWLQPSDGSKPIKVHAALTAFGYEGWYMTGNTIQTSMPKTIWPTLTWTEVDGL